MKPDNAIEFKVPPSLSEMAIEDAICTLGVNLTETVLYLSLTVGGDYSLFEAARLANNMTRDVINLFIRVKSSSEYSYDEWSVTDIDTGKIVWSPGV